MNRSLATLLALLFASIAVSSACFAGPNDQAARLVPYDDLDLSKVSGVKALHRRIDRAINQICLDPGGSASPAGSIDLACKSDAWRSARIQVKDAVAQQQASQSVPGVRTAIQRTEAGPHAVSNR
jgi:UrcA family protein